MEDIFICFVYVYVEQVLDLFDVVNSVVCEVGIEEWIKLVLKVVEQFFFILLVLFVGYDGFDVLFDEVYLVYCLVEEVNDCYIVYFGQVLILLDIIVVNLVVYQLIGEFFVNWLDEVVYYVVENMFDVIIFDVDLVCVYCENLKNLWVVVVWQQWLCLLKQFGVEFSLG